MGLSTEGITSDVTVVVPCSIAEAEFPSRNARSGKAVYWISCLSIKIRKIFYIPKEEIVYFISLSFKTFKPGKLT